MGVTGLWNLIEPCGKAVPVETLENKILAVDISIWLHQVVKGFQDNRGSALANAHLLGLFHRLCKLLYYRIRPVFVFDGQVPQLKRDTIAKRNQSRNKILNEAQRKEALLLQSLAKEKVVQQALGPNAAELLLSPTKGKQFLDKSDKEDDLFKLPPIPEEEQALGDSSQYSTTSASDLDGSFDENPRNYYDCNLQAIDVTSSYFRDLPADVRHELLTDIKETRKQSSWGRLHELPAKSDDFSSFQMKRLLKRRQVQVSMEDAEKEMEGKSLTLNELQNIFLEDGIVDPDSIIGTKPIASNENTRYLLVKNLTRKKDGEKIKKEKLSETLEPDSSVKMEDPKPSTSSKKVENYSEEFDADLELALKMSLEESTVYNEVDYECDRIKLNKSQKRQFKNSANSLARAYMIEYGGMNDDDIKDLLDEHEHLDASFNFRHTDPSLLKYISPNCESNTENITVKLIQNDNDAHECTNAKNKDKTELDSKSNPETILSDSDSESDFIAVSDDDCGPESISTSPKILAPNKLEICLNLSNEFKVDDLFADVFDKNEKAEEIIEIPDSQELIAEIPDSQEIVKLSAETFSQEVIQILDSQEVFHSAIGEQETFVELPENPFIIKTADIKTNPININKIREDLKREVSNINKLNLNDIILDTIVEISDSDSESQKINSKSELSEVIEILDSKISNVSEIPKTPSSRNISGYFETEYVIKRTPDKPNDNDENITNVKSPFFTKKSPRSISKKSLNQNAEDIKLKSPIKRNTSVSKSLFGNETKYQTDDEVTPLREAAELLKQTKNREELESMAKELAKEKFDLENERNRQNRMGTSITERMRLDCMQLLKLFGVPYIVAPMEAEAQCAFLDSTNLTDGTITDDSDIWLFGGKTVYKNFFLQNKHVMEFKVEKIKESFKVDQHKMIQLAILVGSDYTSGIHGIGTVTALEILATFPATLENEKEMSVISSLRKFRDWWMSSKTIPGTTTRNALRKKLKNIDLHEGFPNLAIIEAYLTPTVDDNQEKFSWGTPDVDTIRQFAKKNFGWTSKKTDDILLPVIKRFNERKTQSTIKNYFTVKSVGHGIDLKVSKRVQKAIQKMGTENKSDQEEEPRQPKRSKKIAYEKSKAPTKARKRPSMEAEEVVVPSTSSYLESSICGPKISKKTVNIPDNNEKIPQREKNLVQMELKKARAAELFKKSLEPRKTRSKLK